MNVLGLISGGIDSPVAVGLALSEGHEVVGVHFSNKPFADESAERKSKELLKVLSKRFGKKIKFVVVPHAPNLTAIMKNCERKFTCVLCRRMMLRIAERIALEEECSALLTGESLGQVASQTLSNLQVEDKAVSMLILRPLIGMDKLEIERIAKELGTFEVSIQPGSCCEVVPEKPATKSRLEKIGELERKLNLQELVENALKNRKNFFIE